MKESEIERKVCAMAKARGWLTYKFSSPACVGVPDRIFVAPAGGRVYFIEFKTPKGKHTARQLLIARELAERELPVWTIRSVAEGEVFINTETPIGMSAPLPEDYPPELPDEEETSWRLEAEVLLYHMGKPEWSWVKCCDRGSHSHKEACRCMRTIMDNRIKLGMPPLNMRVVPDV